MSQRTPRRSKAASKINRVLLAEARRESLERVERFETDDRGQRESENEGHSERRERVD